MPPEATILVDPEQVKQVLINILINAIQAQPGGGRITIRDYQEKNESIVSIQDSGPGIDPNSWITYSIRSSQRSAKAPVWDYPYRFSW